MRVWRGAELLCRCIIQTRLTTTRHPLVSSQLHTISPFHNTLKVGELRGKVRCPSHLTLLAGGAADSPAGPPVHLMGHQYAMPLNISCFLPNLVAGVLWEPQSDSSEPAEATRLGAPGRAANEHVEKRFITQNTKCRLETGSIADDIEYPSVSASNSSVRLDAVPYG
ncbi:hypothetical protein Bbelb_385790 [Branchiostoma belcheri]|nr:hypothetical protein Bbelb_385790 [Branchiostoma belcheri]